MRSATRIRRPSRRPPAGPRNRSRMRRRWTGSPRFTGLSRVLGRRPPRRRPHGGHAVFTSGASPGYAPAGAMRARRSAAPAAAVRGPAQPKPGQKRGFALHCGSMPGRPAVFIDRDGCLTEEVGYVNHVSRIRLLPRTAEALRRLNAAGLPAVMATNQSGIAKGYFDAEVLQAVHGEMQRQLAAAGARLDGVYVCTHHPGEGAPPYRADCGCRKPRPGLLRRAAADLDLDLGVSVMVGDKISDVATARAVGAAGVLVLTGYGRGEWEHQRQRWTDKPDHVAEDLLDAVEWVLAHTASGRSRASC